MMKSERIKQILLGLLGVVAAYVWWGNLEMFIDQSTPYVQSEQIEQADLNGEGSISTLEYKNPRVNPFKRFGVDPEPNSLKPKRALRSVAASLPPVSNRYSVTGILLESDQPQAILNDQAGKVRFLREGHRPQYPCGLQMHRSGGSMPLRS